LREFAQLGVPYDMLGQNRTTESSVRISNSTATALATPASPPTQIAKSSPTTTTTTTTAATTTPTGVNPLRDSLSYPLSKIEVTAEVGKGSKQNGNNDSSPSSVPAKPAAALPKQITTTKEILVALEAFATSPVGEFTETDLLTSFRKIIALITNNTPNQKYLGDNGACENVAHILHLYRNLSTRVNDACIHLMALLTRCGDSKEFSSDINIQRMATPQVIAG
jgi:hypothetical protein